MNDLAEFGRLLTATREKRGLTRDEIVTRTKLSPSVVAALEEGDEARLPDKVFIHGHVKVYAAAVGVPENELVDPLLSVPGFLLPTEMSPVRKEEVRRRSAWKVVLGLAVLAALIALVIWFLGIPPEPPPVT